MHYLYELLTTSTDIALFEASLCEGWVCISTWAVDDTHPTEEGRAAYAGTCGICYRNYSSPTMCVDVCTFQSDTRKTVWDMLVETFNIPNFLNDAAKVAVAEVIAGYHSAPAVNDVTSASVNYTMEMMRELQTSNSLVDASRFFAPSWEFGDLEMYPDYVSAEFRKPSPSGGEYVLRFKLTPSTTSYDILRRAFDWGMLEGINASAMQAVIQEDEVK